MADSVDELYGLPLEEFTRARNELAKALADPELRKLRKPSVSAWATNQLSRRREVDVRRLLRAGERLEQAQRSIVSGEVDRGFDEARRDVRQAVRRLRGEAAELLRAGGHAASEATLERLAATLHAASGTEEGRRLLREGRLTDDLQPAGFGVLAGVPAGPGPGRRAPAKQAGTSRPNRDRRAAKARADAEAARADALAAEKDARRVEQEAERLRKAAERAADRAARLEARARELGPG